MLAINKINPIVNPNDPIITPRTPEFHRFSVKSEFESLDRFNLLAFCAL